MSFEELLFFGWSLEKAGSTIIACERLGRICYGMEIEPRYVQLSIERWQNYTGNKAVKLHG